MGFLAGFVYGQAALPVFFCSFRVAGYYPDYYNEELPLSEIRYDKLTDIVYFSIYPNADGSLNLSEINPARQQQLIQSAHQNNVRVSICVGGWGLSDNFSAVAADPATRAAFITNLVQYGLTHDLDGVDLDWEPVSDAADKLNYTALIQELKAAMQPHGLTLSVAVLAKGSEFGPAAIDAIDWLHIMAYDMTRPHSTFEDAVSALQHWESLGVPRSKMILGLPFYGRDADPESWVYYPYKDIVALYAPPPDSDEAAGINFNGINTIKTKTEYALINGLGGVMTWELTNDTSGPASLLTAIAESTNLISPPDFNCDNTIDIADFYHIAGHWLDSDCTADNNWCIRSDLDLSGSVNLSDIARFSSHWIAQLPSFEN